MAIMSGLPPVLVLIFIAISAQFSDSHNVPVFIWGSKSHSTFPALSALSHVSSEQFKDYLKHITPTHKVPVVVFIQDRLSLEDLSSHGNGLVPQGQNYKHLQEHLDQNPSLILPSVKDPFQVLREIKGHESIPTLNYNDDIRRKLSATRSDLTLIYLPPTVGLDNRPEALKANDELMSKAVEHFGHKDYIAFFTGKEPSWDAASEEASHRRISRSLLAATENATHTFMYYIDNVKVKILDKNTQNVTVENATMPTKVEAIYDNQTVVSTWSFDKLTELKKFSLEFNFLTYPNYWKAKVNATFKTRDLEDTVSLKANRGITASKGFSFSCGDTILKASGNYTITVTLHNFQVDPYSKMTGVNSTLPETFHCSTFFTLPLWMGFFTVLFFTAILGLGIYMLFQVKTMDRFDDPKGKTITVPQSE